MLLVVGSAAGGYWFARLQDPLVSTAAELLMPVRATADRAASSAVDAPAGVAQAEKRVLYYRDPMGKPDYSPSPKKDSMGMDYIAVREGEEDEAMATGSAKPGKGKILYYRNPMGLPDTSPAPKKDSMGMDYIPVFEGDDSDDGTLKISPARVQKLGVQTAPVELRALSRTVRAVGTVQPDERRLFVVSPKFEGWIEKLRVSATGQAVRRGDPLMEVYAPELVAAEQEYLLAVNSLHSLQGAGPDARDAAQELAEAALRRLRNWDISNEQLTRLQRSGTVTRTLTLHAAADGVVMDKMAVEGMHFMPGDPLYRIADLSSVWLVAEIFEQDLGQLMDGQGAKISVGAYPNVAFAGKVDFIYPMVSQETRTGKIRILVPNPDGRLKTGMYANVALDSAIGSGTLLAVPDSAIIDSGTRQTVLVERGEGTFEPRAVKLGAHADGSYEVLEGLAADERVVVSANFLIDAESNLRAALKSFSAPATPGSAEPRPAP